MDNLDIFVDQLVKMEENGFKNEYGVAVHLVKIISEKIGKCKRQIVWLRKMRQMCYRIIEDRNKWIQMEKRIDRKNKEEIN